MKSINPGTTRGRLARAAGVAAALQVGVGGVPGTPEAGGIGGATASSATTDTLRGPAVRVTGRATVLESSGEFTLLLAEDGSFCYRANTPLPEAVSWDGVRARGSDMTRVPRTLHDHERGLALLEWWVVGGFWRSPAFPGRIAPQRAGDGAPARRIEVDGGAGRLTLDAEGRPLRLVRETAAGTESTAFSDFRHVGGREVPATIVTSVGNVEVRRLEARNLDTVEDPACPADSTPPAVAFDPRVPSTIEVRRAPTGHLLVRPRLEGREVGWFILDTGGGPGVVTDAVAAELGLPAIGRGVLASFAGTATGTWYRLGELALGPARFGDMPVIGMDLAFLEEPLGTPIAGLIGYGVLSRIVAEVESSTPSLKLHDPATYRSDGDGWEPLKLVDLVPVARGSFPGGEGDFRLDLGAGEPAGGVVFHGPAVERLGLAGNPTTPGEEVAGLPAVMSRLEWFEIGGHRFTGVPALLWLGEDGALADPYLTGNVGLSVLDAFALVLDYAHARFRLRPLLP